MPKSARSNDLFFVTLTIVGWIDIFTRNDYRQLIIDNLNYCRKHKALRVFHYVIMPNHIHLLVTADEKPLSDILRDFKTYTSKQLFEAISQNTQESRRDWMTELFKKAGRENPVSKNFQVWQNGNYPVLLYSKEMTEQKINYIIQNPVRAGFVAEPEHYVFSSASPHSPMVCDEF